MSPIQPQYSQIVAGAAPDFSVRRPALYQVTLPYACFGLEVAGGRVVRVAPIAGWMLGKGGIEVRAWVARKHGTIELVEPFNRAGGGC